MRSTANDDTRKESKYTNSKIEWPITWAYLITHTADG